MFWNHTLLLDQYLYYITPISLPYNSRIFVHKLILGYRSRSFMKRKAYYTVEYFIQALLDEELDGS